MTIHRRYPILVETVPRCPLPDDGQEPPGDVYVADYEQGETCRHDRIGWPFPVAATEDDERCPSWGPDGRVWFLSGSTLFATRPGQRRPQEVLTLDGLEDYVLLRTGLVLSTARPPRQRLWRADLDGGNMRPLSLGNFRPGALLAGPDGASLLAANPDGLFRVDPDTGVHRRLAAGSFHEPSLSPDGGSMVYLRHVRGEPTEVRVRHLGTGRERTVAVQAPGEYLHAPAFSPDGTRVFYSTFRYGEGVEATAWVVPAHGGRPRSLDLHGHFQATRMVPRVA